MERDAANKPPSLSKASSAVATESARMRKLVGGAAGRSLALVSALRAAGDPADANGATRRLTPQPPHSARLDTSSSMRGGRARARSSSRELDMPAAAPARPMSAREYVREPTAKDCVVASPRGAEGPAGAKPLSAARRAQMELEAQDLSVKSRADPG